VPDPRPPLTFGDGASDAPADPVTDASVATAMTSPVNPTSIDGLLREIARVPDAAQPAGRTVRVGERLAGRFEILGIAGRGGMGTVFRARDRLAKCDVALKVLSAAAMHSVARFEREAAILAGLRHPNIVEYVTHGATPDGIHYLVMAWVPGESLHARQLRAPLDARATVAMATQVAHGLAALHARGVVHRDLKPSNLMIAGAGDTATLVDFGVARRIDIATLTRTGAMIGTVGYMAPEQVRGTRDVDARADLFALGCVLYECLTGRRAFSGSNALAVRAKVLIHEPAPIRTFAPALPAALEALVAALLARAPQDRPPDATTVAHALAALDVAAIGPPAGPSPFVDAAPTAHNWCAVMVAWPDGGPHGDAPPVASAIIAGGTVETLDGGLVLVSPNGLDATAQQALALAARFPDAVIVLASGDDGGDALDSCADLLGRINLGAVHPGVWSDRATAARLGASVRVEAVGPRARLFSA
jgi:hypothetical protein